MGARSTQRPRPTGRMRHSDLIEGTGRPRRRARPQKRHSTEARTTEDTMRDSSVVSTAAWGTSEAQLSGSRFTRRRWIAGAAGAAGLALWGTHAAYAQQGTPVASPIPAGRD